MQIGLVMGPWGLTVDEVLAAMREAEELGFPVFYIGDHYEVGAPRESWEPYLLFTLAARETSTMRFGPLVTPITFRGPWELGRWGAQLDILSGGRFVMGLGSAWHEEEHRIYGIPYPPLKERFDRLEEGLEVLQRMWRPGASSFEGRYYRLEGADSLPKPQAGRPPILLGGGGEKRTLNLVARFADEWSAPGLSPAEFRRKLGVLEEHCEAAGRSMATIRRSMLSMGPIGATAKDVDDATQQQMDRTPPKTPMSLAEYRAEMKARGGIVGGVDEIVDSLGQLSEAGVQEALFVWSPGLAPFIASEIIPRAAAL